MLAYSNHLLLLTAATAATTLFFLVIRTPRHADHRHSDPPPCRVSFYEDVLSVDGLAWFSLGKACVRRNGQEICEGPSKRTSTSGADPLGGYQQENVVLKDAFQFWRRTYDEDPMTMLFGQEFLQDFHDTNVPAKATLQAAEHGMASWFPSFKVNGPQVKGFVELSGLMAGSKGKGSQPIAKLKEPGNAFQSGPIAFFNDKCVLILSSASSFMSTNAYYRQDQQAYGYGVMGSVTQIPKGHQLSVLASSAPRSNPDGIRQAFLKWGAKLQRLHATQRPFDFTTRYLQCSTDNGAFYYYQTEPNKNYQETIIDVQRHSNLPFKSWLMDSWWYYQGIGKGVTQWTARPEVFPDGIKAVIEATQWAVIAHNRYWASDTVYAKANGGDYEFVVENSTSKALPLEARFWNDLMANASKTWGLTVYEQDWLNQQTEGMEYTLTSVDAARNWLLQMGGAAQTQGVYIQYCMSYPKHILQSLEVGSVTQARASDDYQPNGNANWDIGLSSMFLSALGIAPTKDNFWSSSAPQNHTYRGKWNHEPASRLHAIVSAFSTAMVAPSDSIQHLNATLIMKTCRQDGRLLQPDWPATPTDASMLHAAGIAMGNRKMGVVWSTYTDLSGFVYTYVLALQSAPFQLEARDLYYSSSSAKDYVAWEIDTDAPLKLLHLPIAVPPSTKTNVRVYAVAPKLDNGYALLGEADTKFVPVSAARFSLLSTWAEGFSVRVHGAPAEVVQMVVQIPPSGRLQTIACQIPGSGVAVFTSQEMACH